MRSYQHPEHDQSTGFEEQDVSVIQTLRNRKEPTYLDLELARSRVWNVANIVGRQSDRKGLRPFTEGELLGNERAFTSIVGSLRKDLLKIGLLSSQGFPNLPTDFHR